MRAKPRGAARTHTGGPRAGGGAAARSSPSPPPNILQGHRRPLGRPQHAASPLLGRGRPAPSVLTCPPAAGLPGRTRRQQGPQSRTALRSRRSGLRATFAPRSAAAHARLSGGLPTSSASARPCFQGSSSQLKFPAVTGQDSVYPEAEFTWC